MVSACARTNRCGNAQWFAAKSRKQMALSPNSGGNTASSHRRHTLWQIRIFVSH
jgi:hypothetical protein